MRPQIKIDLYKARDGWRWRARHRNGRIVADSGEAYTREADVLRAVCQFTDHVRAGEFEIVRIR